MAAIFPFMAPHPRSSNWTPLGRALCGLRRRGAGTRSRSRLQLEQSAAVQPRSLANSFPSNENSQLQGIRGPFEETRAKRRQRFARTFAVRGQPPPPCWGALAATGPTIRSKSAFPPGLPWIGTCCATSSFSRLMFWNSATAFGLTFAGGAALPCYRATARPAVQRSPAACGIAEMHQCD